MKKMIVASLCLVSGSAFANISTSTPNLLGSWLCETVVYHGSLAIQTKNRANYQPSGQATETIQVNYYDKGALQATSNIRLGYRWEMSGSRQKLSNMMIENYDLYNHVTKQAGGFGEISLLKQNLIDHYRDNPWQTITFIDNNTHQYTSDDGTAGICVRES